MLNIDLRVGKQQHHLMGVAYCSREWNKETKEFHVEIKGNTEKKIHSKSLVQTTETKSTRRMGLIINQNSRKITTGSK